MKEISLLEYVKAEHERLDEFKYMWLRMADCNNDNYPSNLSPGDWDEQLITFHYNNPIVKVARKRT